jgi:biotin synthase
MRKEDIVTWLRQADPAELAPLYADADRMRRESVGEQVHLRGLIEISNICVRACHYCGLRAANREVHRYRMTETEILSAARQADVLGYGTVVLQAGETPALTADWVAGIVRCIKSETPLAVTLSLGERLPDELALWRDAGADRYLLRFETSDRDLFRRIHPRNGSAETDRIQLLRTLRGLGYETGSGIMIGIPGQTWSSVADDLILFRELDLDMIGIGPYIAHPATPLGRGESAAPIDSEEQVPNTEEMVYKAVALTRLICPEANIPSTTALATINTRNGRELGLRRGANVVMPNLTPAAYRKHYEIYPNQACIAETPTDCAGCLRGRIRAIGRVPGEGQGGRRRSVA